MKRRAALVLVIAPSVYLLLQQYARANNRTIGGAALDVVGGIMQVVPGYWKIDPRGAPYDADFAAAEQTYNLPTGLLRRMAYQESRFNPNAKSPVGAMGIMQFMPATAAQFGIDPFDPHASIRAAGEYMAQLYGMAGSWRGALAAYNWGIGNVLRKGLDAAPAETVAYMQIANDVGVA